MRQPSPLNPAGLVLFQISTSWCERLRIFKTSYVEIQHPCKHCWTTCDVIATTGTESLMDEVPAFPVIATTGTESLMDEVPAFPSAGISFEISFKINFTFTINGKDGQSHP
ncbi:MAG: hypothetical protein QGF03_06145 [SAR324 cluster bacterium]|nr:hypothetical protein [SAR324 cluster bacterium]